MLLSMTCTAFVLRRLSKSTGGENTAPLELWRKEVHDDAIHRLLVETRPGKAQGTHHHNNQRRGV